MKTAASEIFSLTRQPRPATSYFPGSPSLCFPQLSAGFHIGCADIVASRGGGCRPSIFGAEFARHCVATGFALTAAFAAITQSLRGLLATAWRPAMLLQRAFAAITQCLRENRCDPYHIESKTPRPNDRGVSNGVRRRPIFPGRCQPSIVGAERLNFCVRNGNRWDPLAIITGQYERYGA